MHFVRSITVMGLLLISTMTTYGCSAQRRSSIEHDYNWSHAIKTLSKYGVPREQIELLIADPRFPEYSPIPFSIKPKESPTIYRGFLAQDRIKQAKDLFGRHREIFASAERRFSVDRHVVAAILFVESQFGQNTGEHLVLFRVMRLAELGSQTNLKFNFQRLLQEDPNVTFKEVKERSLFLEQRFAPEVKALLDFCARNKLDPLTLKGSIAGAFGIPQFMPTSALQYSIDGNQDGKISLFNLSDAAHSAAYFLHSFGWKPGLSETQKKEVLWHYNKSDPYIRTVLSIASRLKQASH